VCLEERVQTYATDHPSATSTDPDLPDIIDISQAEWDEINSKIAGEAKVGCCNGVEEAVTAVAGGGCFAEDGRP
jgi:hypothetical protein